LGIGFGHTNVHDDGLIDPDLCPTNAAPGAETPLFLPFDEDDDEMMDDWPEVFVSFSLNLSCLGSTY
jgi:hypothetical protein